MGLFHLPRMSTKGVNGKFVRLRKVFLADDTINIYAWLEGTGVGSVGCEHVINRNESHD